jgi:hypothetical protein
MIWSQDHAEILPDQMANILGAWSGALFDNPGERQRGDCNIHQDEVSRLCDYAHGTDGRDAC